MADAAQERAGLPPVTDPQDSALSGDG